jgi:hypothetical protein
MNDKHKCTHKQHVRLWALGLRKNSATDLYSGEELLDLLPYKLGGRDLVLQKYYNEYKIYYACPLSKREPIPEKWHLAHESLAQLAADRLIWLIEEKLINV